MNIFANIAVSVSLIFSSLLGLFHHSPSSVSTIATSTNQIYFATSSVQFTLDNGWTTPFGKDHEHAYFFGYYSPGGHQIIPSADPATFSLVGPVGGDVIYGFYAKDKLNVYYTDTDGDSLVVLQGSDPSTFTIVPTSIGPKGIAITSESCGNNCYYDAQDKNHKYFQGQIVQ